MKKRLFMAFLTLMTFPILFVCGLTVSAAESKAVPTASVFAQNLEFGAYDNLCPEGIDYDEWIDGFFEAIGQKNIEMIDF